MRELNPKNPFVADSKGVSTRKRPKYKNVLTRETLLDSKTGDVIEEKESIKTEWEFVETTRFVMFYAQYFQQLVMLRRSALLVLCYIVEHLAQNDDLVMLKAKNIAHRWVVGESIIYRGIKQLERYNIIKKSSGSYYYINPYIFYNGNKKL